MVGTSPEDPSQRPQRGEHNVLQPDGRRGDAAFVPEMPERHPKLEQVGGRASRRGIEVGDQAGQRLEPLFSVQGGAEFDDAIHVGSSGVAFGMRHTDRDDQGLARPHDALLAIEGEMGLSGCDDEPFFLAGVDMFSDHTAGRTAPVEAHELTIGRIGCLGEVDPFPGRGIEQCPEAGHGASSRQCLPAA